MNRPTNRAFALAFLVNAANFAALAQTASFTGFTPGNLVLSRSVYTGDAYTVAAGQPLPPVCPATASCGSARSRDR